MKYDKAKEINDYLKNRNIKDIAIAIMNIELNNNGELTTEMYQRYSEQYDYYFDKNDNLAGILNEILQDGEYFDKI